MKILNYDGFWKTKIDEIKSVQWYRLVNIGWLADINMLTSMIWQVSPTKTPSENLFDKNSDFEDFARFRRYAYTCTQQSLPPLWTTIRNAVKCWVQISPELHQGNCSIFIKEHSSLSLCKKLIKRSKKLTTPSDRNGYGISNFIWTSLLYFMFKSIEIVRNILYKSYWFFLNSSQCICHKIFKTHLSRL